MLRRHVKLVSVLPRHVLAVVGTLYGIYPRFLELIFANFKYYLGPSPEQCECGRGVRERMHVWLCVPTGRNWQHGIGYMDELGKAGLSFWPIVSEV